MSGVREEFCAGWREGAEGAGVRDDLCRLAAWARRLPAGLARFLAAQLRALGGMSVALLRDVLRGTPVLAGLILRSLWTGLRAAVRASAGTGAATVAAPAPAKPLEGGGTTAEEPGETETALAQEAPAGTPWRRRKRTPALQAGADLGGLAERAVIAFLVLAVAVTALGMAGSYAGRLLAPYRGGVALGLAAAWCLTAAIVAPRKDAEEDENPTGNDHEKSVGERHQEIDPWPARRERLWKLVEHMAAAGAAGHRAAKGKGVPVDDIAAELRALGAPGTFDRKAMCALLEKAGIPCREQMKFRIGGRQKTPPGVHVDDLAEILGHTPRLPPHLVPDLTRRPDPE